MKTRALDSIIARPVRWLRAWLLLPMAMVSMQAEGLTQIDLIIDATGPVPIAFSLTPADGPITAALQEEDVSITFFATVPVSPKTSWFLNFAPLEGTVLQPGNYPSTQRWPFQSPKRPGLDITGNGTGCNTSTGKFTVYEATFDSAGQVVAFAADAEQDCGTVTQARVRFNSNVPLQLPAPQSMPGWPQEVYEETQVTLDGSQS